MLLETITNVISSSPSTTLCPPPPITPLLNNIPDHDHEQNNENFKSKIVEDDHSKESRAYITEIKEEREFLEDLSENNNNISYDTAQLNTTTPDDDGGIMKRKTTESPSFLDLESERRGGGGGAEERDSSSSNINRQGVILIRSSYTTPNQLSKMSDNKRRYYERENNNYSSSYNNHNNSSHHHHRESAEGEVPNCRLFILCGRTVKEEELREAFCKFGDIRELWIVKDKNTGESKGVAYITFSKTSEAAIALEEMNGKFLGNNAKSLRVLIANSRDQGTKRETNEDERFLRLFIIVPKSLSESELRDHFSQFGDIDRCNIVKDKGTKESKGYAYVSFHRISHAAKAYEGCDRSFRPKFADPRPVKSHDDRYGSAHGSSAGNYDGGSHDYGDRGGGGGNSHHELLSHHSSASYHGDLGGVSSYSSFSSSLPPSPSSCSLTLLAHGSLNQDQLWRLCDFCPGLDYCTVRSEGKGRGVVASVLYTSPGAAAYAKEKLHGFEYPPGQRLIAKFDNIQERSSNSLLGPPVVHSRYNGSGGGGGGSGKSPPVSDLARILEVQAQAIIQAGGLSSYSSSSYSTPTGGGGGGESYDPSYCSVKLPSPQPLAPMDSTVVERLFVVCHPSPPPLYALKDVFGRFGALIDIFMLNGKNFGYAKYGNKNSADEARNILHGQEVCGMRLKVLLADPQEKQQLSMNSSTASSSHEQKCKRLKTEESRMD